MISDEQGRADGDSDQAGYTYVSASESATRSDSHPAFAAGGHTRIPSDFPHSTR